MSLSQAKEKGGVVTPQEFENWVHDYHDAVYSVALRITGNEDDALDMTQEVFLKAYQKRGQYHGEGSIGAWLRRIAVNQCYNFVSRGKTKNWEEMDETRFTYPGDDEVPRQFDIRHLDILSPLERSVLVARIYENMPFKDVAESLNTSENTAKVSYHRAIKKLQKVMR